MFLLRHGLVVPLAFNRGAQVADAVATGVDDEEVLVTMHLLAPTIAFGLLFRVLGTLTASLRAVDDQVPRLMLLALVVRKRPPVALRQHPQLVQGCLHH